MMWMMLSVMLLMMDGGETMRTILAYALGKWFYYNTHACKGMRTHESSRIIP